MRKTIAVGLTIGAVALAGCGSSNGTDPTHAAASCLRNALANQALKVGDNCGDPSAAQTLKQMDGAQMNVSCTRRDGNEYVCDVKIPNATEMPVSVQSGFYDVTYDGHSIVYQPDF